MLGDHRARSDGSPCEERKPTGGEQNIFPPFSKWRVLLASLHALIHCYPELSQDWSNLLHLEEDLDVIALFRALCPWHFLLLVPALKLHTLVCLSCGECLSQAPTWRACSSPANPPGFS